MLADDGDTTVTIPMRLWEYLATLYERETHERLAATRRRRAEGRHGIPAEAFITDDTE